MYAADGSPERLIEAILELRRRGRVIAAWPRWLSAPLDWTPPSLEMRI